MKIIYLVHQFYPEYGAGTEKFVYNSAFMAQLNGNRVKVITYSFYENFSFIKEANGFFYKEYFFGGIPVLAYKHKIQPIDLSFSLVNDNSYEYAKNILIKESPNLLHIGHPMRTHQFIRAARDLNIPYIITLTDFFLLCPKVILAPNSNSLCYGPNHGKECKKLCSEFSNRFIIDRLKLGEIILKNAKAIVSPSKFLVDIFTNEYPQLEFQIIGHGINYKHIKPNNNKYFKGSKLVFGFVGTLTAHKGIHVLIQAFNKIPNPNIVLKIFGTGEDNYVNELKKMTNGNERIHFMGTFLTEELGNIFKDIDVMVIPSVSYETYQFVLHESLSSNIPVICSDLGAMSEKIIDGFNGLKFLPGNVKDLALKISMLANEPEILNLMKENIKKNNIIPNIEQEAYKYNKIYIENAKC